MVGKVILAEDDVRQAQLAALYLKDAGFEVQVVGDGGAALEAVRTSTPDLVLLDWMMPGLDGLSVARVLRGEGSDVPILLLTARTHEDDMLAAFDLGVDDYLTKPYAPRVLVARVARAIKRHQELKASPPEEVTRLSSMEVDRRRHEVRIDGSVVEVTPKEFAVLAALCSEPGRAFSRRQLIEVAFGFDYEGLERTVDVHVGNLRRKVEADPREPRYVLTVPGRGYRVPEPHELTTGGTT
jgi:DNA-binding response OmpR family regulator